MKILLLILLSIITINGFSQKEKFITFEKNTTNGTKVGLISTVLKDTILPAIYDEFFKINDGYISARKNEKCGIVDTNNKIIIPFVYDFISLPSEGRLFVGQGEKAALCDLSNKLLTDFIFDNVWNFSEGIALVQKVNNKGYINKSGQVIIPIKYFDCTEYCKKGLVVVHSKSWESFGNTTIQKQSVNVGYSTEYPIVYNNKGSKIYQGQNIEKIEILDSTGIIFSELSNPNCGNPNIKMFNKLGKLIYKRDCIYFEKANDFIMLDGKNGNKVGILTFKGEEKLKPIFKKITKFEYNENTLARVYFQDDTFFYINKEFNCIEFDSITCPN